MDLFAHFEFFRIPFNVLISKFWIFQLSLVGQVPKLFVERQSIWRGELSKKNCRKGITKVVDKLFRRGEPEV